MTDVIKRVVVLGGGSAGWIAAGLIASTLKRSSQNTTTAAKVVVVESPDVKTIGVGEGSWPTLRQTLADIGISERLFLTYCDASFKQGTEFVNWRYDTSQQQINNTNSNESLKYSDRYYHPFTVPYCYPNEPNIVAKWLSSDNPSFAHFSSPQALICDNDKAPKTAQDPDYAGFVNYGFHFNADKLGQLLKQHCIEHLNVEYISDHITDVVETDDGSITSLTSKQSGQIQGDLFVDCSGLKSVLLGEHYKIPWQSQAPVLFNNRAIAIQTPYESKDSPIPSSTRSVATDIGWMWDISLQSRRGTGIVYCDKYCTDEEAELTLRQYLQDTSGTLDTDALPARKIKFEPGYRETFWHKNCVAVGMAAGFIEPLEASALVMVELSSQYICKHLPLDKTAMPVIAKRFNELFRYRWEKVIDFLKYHYVLSERQSPYWLAHQDPTSIPESLQELMTLWQSKSPEHTDLWQQDEIFSAASYQYVLLGMKPEQPDTFGSALDNQKQQTNSEQQQLKQQSEQLLRRLPTNRELLEWMSKDSSITSK